MKQFPISCLLITLFIIGCSEENSSVEISTDATTLIENVNALAFDQDIEDLLSDVFSLEASSEKTAVSSNKTFYKFKNRYGRCATITHDEENNHKTIFFDGECIGRRGQSRTGTIVITYSEEQDAIGSFRQTYFDDFYLNGVKIEGTRRSEITNIDADGNFTRHATLSDGKMIY